VFIFRWNGGGERILIAWAHLLKLASHHCPMMAFYMKINTYRFLKCFSTKSPRKEIMSTTLVVVDVLYCLTHSSA